MSWGQRVEEGNRWKTLGVVYNFWLCDEYCSMLPGCYRTRTRANPDIQVNRSVFPVFISAFPRSRPVVSTVSFSSTPSFFSLLPLSLSLSLSPFLCLALSFSHSFHLTLISLSLSLSLSISSLFLHSNKQAGASLRD